MTLDEAIEIKVAWRKNNYPPPLADEMNADMLSIEALKRLKHERETIGRWHARRLSGETEP